MDGIFPVLGAVNDDVKIVSVFRNDGNKKRLKDLEAQKIEEENAQIVQMVKAVHLDGTQLAAFLSAYASGEIALPQPDADYTDEQEETEDEA